MRQQPVTDFRSEYATRTDFCNVFTDHTQSLYLLAFLLTTTHAAAEHCFVDAIELAFKSNTVFKEWATSWTKRTLIARAITTIFDASNRCKRSADTWFVDCGEGRPAIEAITHLADLDRFVFVMSILESYPVYECSLLLGYPACAVIESRARALRDLPTLNSCVDQNCVQSVKFACSTQKSALASKLGRSP